MKKNILPLLALAAIATTAIGVDTIDVMLRKIFGTNQPPNAPPLALTSHALVGKNNTVVVNAYNGSLEFQGSIYNNYLTRIAITNPTAVRTVTLPDGSGTVGLQAKAVLSPSSTVSYAPGSSVSCSTLVPAQAETINAVTTGAIAGRAYYLVVTTSGSSSYTLTFAANFKVAGTLATGTASGKVFVVQFIFDGVNFNEVSRTAAM